MEGVVTWVALAVPDPLVIPPAGAPDAQFAWAQFAVPDPVLIAPPEFNHYAPHCGKIVDMPMAMELEECEC